MLKADIASRIGISSELVVDVSGWSEASHDALAGVIAGLAALEHQHEIGNSDVKLTRFRRSVELLVSDLRSEE